MNANEVKLFSVAVGERRNRYYMSRFERFESKGLITPSWNWGCFFFGWFWFLYRKMPLACLAYVAVLYLVYVFLFSLFSDTPAQYTFLFFYFVLVPAYANQLYYLILKRKIEKLMSRGNAVDSIAKTLASSFQTISDSSDKNPDIL